MHVYPGIFAAAGLIRLGVTGSGVLSRWSQSIRDTEFLVEMRLRNYEQDRENEKQREEKVRVGDEADGVMATEGAIGAMPD
jgi:E3 ubiquitin-protein ligase MARCH6